MASFKLINLERFQQALDEYTAKVNKSPVLIAKKLSLDVITRVVPLTRKATGQLTGGWGISFGTQPIPVSDNPYADGVSRIGQDSAINQNVINRAGQKISEFDGGVIWVSNSVEYAEYREYGTASQEGDFMFSQAVNGTIDSAFQLAREAVA